MLPRAPISTASCPGSNALLALIVALGIQIGTN